MTNLASLGRVFKTMYINLYLRPDKRNQSNDTVTNCFHLSKNNDAETKKTLQINPTVEKGDTDPFPSAMFINSKKSAKFNTITAAPTVH